MTKTTLHLTFKDDLDKDFTLKVDNPQQDIADEQVKAAMENIKEKNIFLRNLSAVESAKILNITEKTLAVK